MEERLNPYEFYFKSSPLVIDTSKVPLGQFDRIYFESGIGSFYPYGEVYLKDESGIVSDKLIFIEGLTFQVKIGNEDEDYIENSFCWSESQLIDTTLSNHLSGIVPIILIDDHYKNDVEVSKAFVNKKASDVVREIVVDTMGIDTDKVHISETKGVDTWYQMNETNQAFIKRLSNEAISSVNAKSPILTFINTDGHFYFMSIEEMMTTQTSVGSYRLEFSQYASVSFDHLQDYELMFGGMPINFDNYTMKAYKVTDSASYAFTEDKIQDYVYKSSKDKILVREELQKHTSTRYMGIQESTSDQNFIQGKINSEFKDANLAIRMSVVIKFNSKCVAGNIVEIEDIESQDSDKIVAQEYSGKWLITEDKLLLSEEGGLYMNLTLNKPSLTVDSDHPFIKEFL